MNIFITFSLIVLIFGYGKHSGLVIAAPSTDLTGTGPSSTVSINATWTFSGGVNVTNVIMTVRNLQAAQWAAVGLGLNMSMGEAHVFVCKRLADNTIVVQRYINPHAHHVPEPAGPDQGGVFTPGQQQFMEGVVICQFSLSNFTQSTSEQVTDLQPLSQSGSYHPLFAAGVLDTSDNSLTYHGNDSRTVQVERVQLDRNEIILYKLSNSNNAVLIFGYGKHSGLIAAVVLPATPLTDPAPTSNVSINATWTFSSGDKVTNVIMTVRNLQAAEWAAVGLGQKMAMGEAHVFVCKRLANNTIVVQRYINPEDHHHPEPAGSEQGGVFTPGQQQFIEGVVTCQFSLSNFTQSTSEQVTDLNPLSQSGSYHPLFAAGLLNTSDNSLTYHGKDSRTFRIYRVQLSRNEILLYKLTNPTNAG